MNFFGLTWGTDIMLINPKLKIVLIFSQIKPSVILHLTISPIIIFIPFMYVSIFITYKYLDFPEKTVLSEIDINRKDTNKWKICWFPAGMFY